MSNRKTLDERLEAAKLEAVQKQKRVQELLQQQRAKERKARTHRFCERGGKLEKRLPDLARLTEEEFEIFMEMVLLTDFSRSTLAELAPPPVQNDAEPNVGAAETVTAKSPTTTANAESAPATKPAETAQNVRTNGNIKPADTSKATS